ncbi:hypothetical protein AB1E18_004342 [Capra hircus]
MKLHSLSSSWSTLAQLCPEIWLCCDYTSCLDCDWVEYFSDTHKTKYINRKNQHGCSREQEGSNRLPISGDVKEDGCVCLSRTQLISDYCAVKYRGICQKELNLSEVKSYVPPID